MSTNCVILVFNKDYASKASSTFKQLREVGAYADDVVLLTGNDLIGEDLTLAFPGAFVIHKHFPDFDRRDILEILKNKNVTDTREFTKPFQWHKLHCFDVFFKQWAKCMYIDAGMHIFKSIDRIMNLKCEGHLVAHSDAYPSGQRELTCQFNYDHTPLLYEKLIRKYKLNVNYFQSGVMLYDTKLIDGNTKSEIFELSREYYNCRTNEQGILNLYFNCHKNVWSVLPVSDSKGFLYDFWERGKAKKTEYVMLKYPKT